MTILGFLSSTAGIVAEVCITVLAVTIAALIGTGKIKLKKLKAGGTEVEFNNSKEKNNLENEIHQATIKLSQETIDNIMKVVNRELNDSLGELKVSAEKYHELIKKGDNRAVDKAIRNYLIAFPKLFSENDDRNNIDTNDILELYLTKDINNLIIEKLQELYNDPETRNKEEIELNEITEDLVKDIITSLKCNIRNYRLLANTSEELTKLFDESARELLDYLKTAIKGYIRYSASEKQDRIDLIQKRNDTISEQISNIANGGTDA